jgi:soluble P-type ATPase
MVDVSETVTLVTDVTVSVSVASAGTISGIVAETVAV